MIESSWGMVAVGQQACVAQRLGPVTLWGYTWHPCRPRQLAVEVTTLGAKRRRAPEHDRP